MMRNFNDGLDANFAKLNALAEESGDGFLMNQGYTIVWYGWQADVLPGDNRLTLKVPAARNADGSAVTGIVRTELTLQRNRQDAQSRRRLVHDERHRQLSDSLDRQQDASSPTVSCRL